MLNLLYCSSFYNFKAIFHLNLSPRFIIFNYNGFKFLVLTANLVPR